MLNIVSIYINNYLNLSKFNFYDCLKEDFANVKSITENLTNSDVSEETYIGDF